MRTRLHTISTTQKDFDWYGRLFRVDDPPTSVAAAVGSRGVGVPDALGPRRQRHRDPQVVSDSPHATRGGVVTGPYIPTRSHVIAAGLIVLVFLALALAVAAQSAGMLG